jgi:FixJ family two-component response regulator
LLSFRRASPVKEAALAKKPLISIVDDDPFVLEATTSLLESHGYVTASFGSAQAFLQSSHLQDTSCLVTDLHMPELSGVELQHRLSRAGHRIPTIVITAHCDDYMHAAALKSGALALLTKPVSEARLISCLERALQLGRT